MELKARLRTGSKAAASVPWPIGREATTAPEVVSTTVITLLAQVLNSRWEAVSMARPWALVQPGIGQRASIALVFTSMRTISFLSAPLT